MDELLAVVPDHSLRGLLVEGDHQLRLGILGEFPHSPVLGAEVVHQGIDGVQIGDGAKLRTAAVGEHQHLGLGEFLAVEGIGTILRGGAAGGEQDAGQRKGQKADGQRFHSPSSLCHMDVSQ